MPMAAEELLSTEGLIRRLKKGSPIVLEKETIRLPRFTEIKEVEQRELGGKGKENLVIARSRTATWAMMPWPKKTAFGLKDAQAFIKLVEGVQQLIPQKPVKGYVLAGVPVKEDGAELLEDSGHLASVVAE